MTCSSTNIDCVGCTDNWHSYRPRSSSRIDLMRNDQWPMWRVCSTWKRSSLLYVDRPTVSSWKSLRRIHDTYFDAPGSKVSESIGANYSEPNVYVLVIGRPAEIQLAKPANQQSKQSVNISNICTNSLYNFTRHALN